MGDPTIVATVLGVLRRSGTVVETEDELHAWLDETLDKTTGSWQLCMIGGEGSIAALDAQLTMVVALRSLLGYPPGKTAAELVEAGAHRNAHECTVCHHVAVKGTGLWACGLGCVCSIRGGCLPGRKVTP